MTVFFFLFAPDLDFIDMYLHLVHFQGWNKNGSAACISLLIDCWGRSYILALKRVKLDKSEVNILLRRSFSRPRRRGTKSNDLNIKVRGTKSWSATKRGFIWVAKKGGRG